MESQLDEQLDYLQNEYASSKSGPGINSFPWVEDMLDTWYLWIRTHEQCRGTTVLFSCCLMPPFPSDSVLPLDSRAPRTHLFMLHIPTYCMCVLSPALCDPMDRSLSGSSVHGILQAKILECVVIPFSRGSSQPRDQTQASRTAGRFFSIWVTEYNHIHLITFLIGSSKSDVFPHSRGRSVQ